MIARKRFGQHFLARAWVAKVVAAIAPRPDDVFLEIGPGRGELTRPLAAGAARVVAVEVDRDLASTLVAEQVARLEVVVGDVLAIDLESVLRNAGPEIRCAGNLPYNVSSPILFRLLALSRSLPALRDATLMLQKEVADRLVARPGTGEYGVLGICVGLYADVERLFDLPPGAFRPPPKVTSTLVRLRYRPPTVPLPDPALFHAMVRSLFTLRRKMLGNALAPFAGLHGRSAAELLARAGLDPTRRPETLDLAELSRLAGLFGTVPR